MRALATVVVALLMMAPSPAAAADGELDDARRSADAVAAELAQSQSRLAELENEIAALEARAADGIARRAALEGTVRALAVDTFMRASPPAIPVFDDDLTSVVRADALAGFVARDNLDAVDEYRLAGEEIDAAHESLETVRAEEAAAVSTFRQRAEAANSELGRLQRLDQERRAAEEAERAQRQEAEARAAVARASAGGPAPAPGAGTSSSSTSPAPSNRRPAPNRQAPATTEAPARSPAPAPAPARETAGEWICPVQGPLAFSNDWGQPRSGGRRHQGNDILSPRGTPVVASVAGNVRPHQSGMGGISYYLRGDDGNTYFGTHLDSLSGASGRVSAGAVLGYVGNSGNASGGPTHLHFEIHPGGGGAVNPYPTLRRHC